MDMIAAAVAVLAPAERILVFTGAGISTESGIPDFRGPDGLWTKVDPSDFDIDRFLTEPDLRVQRWRMHADGELWGARSTVQPNDAHLAIVRLHGAGRLSGCVTQNIDGLHLVAGLPASHVAELHGDVRRARCVGCGAVWPTEEVLVRVDAGEDDPPCPHCGGIIKTSTVMFGELLPEDEMAKAERFANEADAVLVVGSTVSVWPAAGIPISMVRAGKPMIIVNRGETEADHLADVVIEERASVAVTAIVDALVGHGVAVDGEG